jgi:uncharacterized OB-fold protein
VSRSFSVPQCRACAHAIWPPRPVCPRCSGTTFSQRDAGRGVIEETTRSGETLLASVRTHAGPIVIARLEGGASAGAGVDLVEDFSPRGGAIVIASPASGE